MKVRQLLIWATCVGVGRFSVIVGVQASWLLQHAISCDAFIVPCQHGWLVHELSGYSY